MAACDSVEGRGRQTAGWHARPRGGSEPRGRSLRIIYLDDHDDGVSERNDTNPYPAPGGIPSATTSSMLHNEIPAAFKGRTLVVALDATYPPDEMMQGNTVIGMDADFAYSIGQVLGVKVSLVNATFDGIIPGLLSGKYDIGDSSFTDTKAREEAGRLRGLLPGWRGFLRGCEQLRQLQRAGVTVQSHGGC